MKRLFGLFVFGIILSSTAFAQNGITDFRLSCTNFVDTIPVEFRYNQLLVPVEIDGSMKLFLLDTGASIGLVFNTSALNLQKNGKRTHVGDVNARTDSLSVATLPHMRIGKTQIENYPVWVSSPMISLVCSGVDGIIGFNLFQGKLSIKIDVAAKRIILTDRKDFFKDEKGFALKYKLYNHIPFVWIRPFENTKEEVSLDTGANVFYSLCYNHYTFFNKRRKKVKEQVKVRTTGYKAEGLFGMETDAETLLLQLDELKWGKFSFKQVTTTTQVNGESRIGAGILNYGSLIIATPQQKIIFQPFNHELSCVLTENNPIQKIFFDLTENQVRISLIWEESDAYKQGARKGDIVMQVDGIPIDDVCTFVHLISEKKENHQSARLLLRNEKHECKEISLSLP